MRKRLLAIWLPARMVAGNIAQYIVVIYTLFGGIALTEHVLTNFDKESAKQTFRDILEERTFSTVLDDGIVESDLVGNMSSLVSQYMLSMEANGTADFGCSNSTTGSVEDILATYCSSSEMSTKGCDPSAPVNYLCQLLDPAAAQSLNATSRQALLAGSGFDQEFMKEIARNAIYQANDASVDTLYPS